MTGVVWIHSNYPSKFWMRSLMRTYLVKWWGKIIKKKWTTKIQNRPVRDWPPKMIKVKFSHFYECTVHFFVEVFSFWFPFEESNSFQMRIPITTIMNKIPYNWNNLESLEKCQYFQSKINQFHNHFFDSYHF